MATPIDTPTGTTLIRDFLAEGALVELFDGVGADGFERLARLAARALDAPLAAVTLIDGERIWSPGAFGFDGATDLGASSIVGSAARAGEALVVRDTRTDARFADDPIVANGPRVRAIVATPLLVEPGHSLGSLCVFDVAPRPEASDVQLEVLRDLADVVVEDLAHRVRHRELLAAQAEAGRLATTDPLTGLSNRRKLDDTLDQAIALARRTGHALALLMIDLDGFKGVNDRYGHELGDDVLVEMAQRLSHGVREHDLVARMGGDEFVVVLQAVDRAAVAEAAGRLHEALTRDIAALAGGGVVPNSVRLRVSVGVALFPADGEDMASLLRAADLAMYEAKASGGGVRRYAAR
ncbi:sensor domain-containing diguanylate cyclase [soil metagenome]|nr:sensor domain-containing diguanylate cyclase [Trueperaceae bacterium]